MSDERGRKGTVTYQIKGYVHNDRINIRSCDILVGTDNLGNTWVLIRQDARP